MSRLGKAPITIPKGVEVKAGKDGLVTVKGPKGSLDLTLPSGYKVREEKGLLFLEQGPDVQGEGAMHGLYRSLLKNCVVGVSEGYEIRLMMIGVGYRAAVQGNRLDLQVGYSHPTLLDIPSDIKVTVDKGTTIILNSIDKRSIGQFAATVRAKKPPEPYKGKGIRYEFETVRKKEGKAAKGKA